MKRYEGSLVNGRPVSACESPAEASAEIHDPVLLWDAGKIVAGSPSADSWGTVNASNGWLLPGLVTIADEEAEAVQWARKGVTTLVAPAPHAGSESGNASELDRVVLRRIDATANDAAAFDAAPEAVIVDVANSALPRNLGSQVQGVRVAIEHPEVSEWIDVAAAHGVPCIVYNVSAETLPLAQRVKSGRSHVALETSEVAVSAAPHALGEALVREEVDICAISPHATTNIFEVLGEIADHETVLTTVTRACALTPAKYYGVGHRKGSFDLHKDADVVVIGAQTPGMPKEQLSKTRIACVLRRGKYLFLQNQVHVKTGTGKVLHPLQDDRK